MFNYKNPLGIPAILRRWTDRRFQETATRMTGIDFPVHWTGIERVGARSIVLAELCPPDLPSGIRGYAVDRKRPILMVKALMEGLESVAIRDAGLELQSRTGMAAHFREVDARESAYRELLERDALLFHWLSECPGRPVELAPVRAELQGVPEGESLRAVSLRSVDPSVAVCFVGSRSPRHGCWHVGLGTGSAPESALGKALGEWTASVFAHRGDRCPTETKRSPRREALSAHHAGTRDPEVAALLEHVLAGTEAPEADDPREGQDLRTSTRFSPLPSRSPRYAVVRAENALLLPLLFSDAFFAHRAEYLASPRLARELARRPRRHHGGERFLPHPID